MIQTITWCWYDPAPLDEGYYHGWESSDGRFRIAHDSESTIWQLWDLLDLDEYNSANNWWFDSLDKAQSCASLILQHEAEPENWEIYQALRALQAVTSD